MVKFVEPLGNINCRIAELMVLPIISYGNGILRQKCNDIDPNHPDLNQLIDSMWETLYPADGSGLAAPQINQSLKLFIVDTQETYSKMDPEDREELFDGDSGIKETFINARIVDRSEEYWIENEGCLSIPSLSEEVERAWGITIEYFDRELEPQRKVFKGITARVIQHEFDHTEGKLYIDHVKPLKRKLLCRKLTKISKGQINTKYKMQYPK